MLLGLALAAGYITQTLGLRTARATVSGFITGLFVVFTPLVAAVVLRRRVPAAAWGGVAVATAGLALLSLHGLSIGIGEALTLLCALAYAVHIVGLERWSSSYAADGLAVVQLLTVAVLCGVLAVAGRPGLPPDAGVWGAIVLTGVAGTAVAFFVQTWAQARLSATRAAVVMTMEPVFAGVFGVAVGGDRVTVRLVVGALLVLSAMFLVELGPRHGADAGVERLEV
jgi:drug/metabolite transporter (DMT)-like permease